MEALINDWPRLSESLATDWLTRMPESSWVTHSVVSSFFSRRYAKRRYDCC